MTEEERYEKLNDKLDRILEKIDNRLDAVSGTLQNHEVRIVVLEKKEPREDKRDWKSEIIMLLAKAVVIGGVSIASLVGASGLIQKMIGA